MVFLGRDDILTMAFFQLLNDLAPIMQAQLCLTFAIPHIKALAQDPMFRVRKAVASHMGNICKAIGPEETTTHLVRFSQTPSSQCIAFLKIFV